MKTFNQKIVISQPMYFPWVGMFEQIYLSDIFVFYDDVQFSKGSFTNRVQIKTTQGSKWLTVPLKNLKLGLNINETLIEHKKDWRRSQLDFLKNTYKNHKYYEDVLSIATEVFKNDYENIAELSIKSMQEVLKYFNIKKDIYKSSSLKIGSSSSERVFKIVNYFNAKVYITGHGAKRYLNHELFEKNGIEIRYIDYALLEYPQTFGEFTPYVSILDLIANEGENGIQYFKSKTKN